MDSRRARQPTNDVVGSQQLITDPAKDLGQVHGLKTKTYSIPDTGELPGTASGSSGNWALGEIPEFPEILIPAFSVFSANFAFDFLAPPEAAAPAFPINVGFSITATPQGKSWPFNQGPNDESAQQILQSQPSGYDPNTLVSWLGQQWLSFGVFGVELLLNLRYAAWKADGSPAAGLVLKNIRFYVISD